MSDQESKEGKVFDEEIEKRHLICHEGGFAGQSETRLGGDPA